MGRQCTIFVGPFWTLNFTWNYTEGEESIGKRQKGESKTERRENGEDCRPIGLNHMYGALAPMAGKSVAAELLFT